MKIIFFMSTIFFMITILLILLLNLISSKTFLDREKSSPFECGFDPKNPARLPFSLQVFLIAVIFLIFDIEITLLLPLIMTMKISSIANFILISSFFIIILIMCLFHEWNQGARNWTL